MNAQEAHASKIKQLKDEIVEAAKVLLVECEIMRSHEGFSLKPHPDTVADLRKAVDAYEEALKANPSNIKESG